jgi:hypothetical protein
VSASSSLPTAATASSTSIPAASIPLSASNPTGSQQQPSTADKGTPLAAHAAPVGYCENAAPATTDDSNMVGNTTGDVASHATGTAAEAVTGASHDVAGDGAPSERSNSSTSTEDVSVHDALDAPDPSAYDVTVAAFWREAAIQNNIAAGREGSVATLDGTGHLEGGLVGQHTWQMRVALFCVVC